MPRGRGRRETNAIRRRTISTSPCTTVGTVSTLHIGQSSFSVPDEPCGHEKLVFLVHTPPTLQTAKLSYFHLALLAAASSLWFAHVFQACARVANRTIGRWVRTVFLFFLRMDGSSEGSLRSLRTTLVGRLLGQILSFRGQNSVVFNGACALEFFVFPPRKNGNIYALGRPRTNETHRRAMTTRPHVAEWRCIRKFGWHSRLPLPPRAAASRSRTGSTHGGIFLKRESSVLF